MAKKKPPIRRPKRTPNKPTVEPIVEPTCERSVAPAILRNLTIAALVFALLFAVAWLSGDRGGNKPTPDPDPVVDFVLELETPPAELQAAVEPIRAALAGKPNATAVGQFFYHLAAAGDVAEIKNTIQLAKVAETVSRQIDLVGGDLVAPIAADCERLFAEFCRPPRILSDEDRDRWRAICRAIAWACLNGNADVAADLPAGQVAEYVCCGHCCELKPIPDSSPLAKTPVLPDSLEYRPNDGPPQAGPLLLGDAPPNERGPPPAATVPAADAEKRGEVPQARPEWQTHGLTFDPAEHKRFAEQVPEFSALPHESGEGKIRLLYRAARQFDPTLFSDESQTTGDCTSHGTRNACSAARAFAILAAGTPQEWRARGATEAIYGYRGHSGAGMSVERAAEFVSRVGGVAIRKQYADGDLSRYNSKTGELWGARGGPPKRLVDELKQTPIGHAALVRTLDEARDAIYNGFALTVGSNVSFSRNRDRDGFASRTPEGWAHCMAWVGVDDTIDKRGPCFLVCNSWGKWNGGPRGAFDIPDGSFWIRPDVAAYMIGQRQAVAIGNFRGHEQTPPADLHLADILRTAGGPRFHLRFVGLLPVAIAVGVNALIDPTIPENILAGDGPPPGPAPNVCERCGGDGWIGDYPNGYRCICKAAAEFDAAVEKAVDDRDAAEKPFAWLDAAEADRRLKSGDVVFVLVTVDGCGPCVALKRKIESRNDCRLLAVALDKSDPLAAGLVAAKRVNAFPQLFRVRYQTKPRPEMFFRAWDGKDLAAFLAP